MTRATSLAIVLLLAALWAAAAATRVNAQTTLGGQAASFEERVAAAEHEAALARSGADNAFTLAATGLVFLMTAPGLALFYGGQVRRKNVLGTMMQSFLLVSEVALIWAAVGYSLCFSSGNAFIGGFGAAFLRGVGALPNPYYAPTIPEQSFMVFELMFATITPALITGAIAERVQFRSALVFTGLWTLVVYAPVAHMVWGHGGFLNASTGGGLGVMDFAGGLVVHATSGVSAIVAALYVGRRAGYPKQAMPPHSVVLSFAGVCLLWVGSFGLNAGSAHSAGALATSALVATHLAAAAGSVAWAIAERVRYGRSSALGAISGCVAGLVAIAPASGFVRPLSAVLIGAIAGAVCHGAVAFVKTRTRCDDSLDVFGLHGIGGTLGALLTGVFATSAVNPILDGAGNALPRGVVDGNWHAILGQLAGAGLAWTLAAVGTYVVLKIVDLSFGLRLSEEHEVLGLDLTQHGEQGYSL